MSIVKAALASAFMLALPANALAADASSFPLPAGTFCEQAKCYTITHDDVISYTGYQEDINGSGFYHTGNRAYSAIKSPDCWYVYSSMAVWRSYGSPSSMRICVRTGSQLVTRVYEQYLFNDIPAQDRGNFYPEKKLHIGEYYSNFNLISRTIRVDINDSTLPSVRPYCNFYRAEDRDTSPISGVGIDRTPQSVMTACSFSEKLSDYLARIERESQQPEGNSNNNNSDNDNVVIPPDTTSCGHVNNGNEIVSVRSNNNNCKDAKNVLRSYSKTLRSPSGWSCSASMNDSKFKARCAKKRSSSSRARARSSVAYGVWTRR